MEVSLNRSIFPGILSQFVFPISKIVKVYKFRISLWPQKLNKSIRDNSSTITWFKRSTYESQGYPLYQVNLSRSVATLVSIYRKELYEENSLLELTFLTFLVPIIKFFVFTKNGNKKGYKCNKGLKIPIFSYVMRSKVTLPRFV